MSSFNFMFFISFVHFVYSSALPSFGVASCNDEISRCAGTSLCTAAYFIASAQCSTFDLSQNVVEFAECLLDVSSQRQLRNMAGCLARTTTTSTVSRDVCMRDTVACLMDSNCSEEWDRVEQECTVEEGVDFTSLVVDPSLFWDCATRLFSWTWDSFEDVAGQDFSNWYECITVNPGDFVPESLCHENLLECYGESLCTTDFNGLQAACPFSDSDSITSWWSCVTEYAEAKQDDAKLMAWMHCVIQNFFPDAESEEGCMTDVRLCDAADAVMNGENNSSEEGSDEMEEWVWIVLGFAGAIVFACICCLAYFSFVGSKAEGEVMQQGDALAEQPAPPAYPAKDAIPVETIGTYSEGHATGTIPDMAYAE